MKELKTLQKNRPGGCPYVFLYRGKPVRDFRNSWDKACLEAGLWKMDKDEKGKEIKVPPKIFHDFRRTAVRNMLRSGIREKVAMMISGHKTRSVCDRYHIVSDEDLKEAARKQQAYHENKNERLDVPEQGRGEVIPFPLKRVKRRSIKLPMSQSYHIRSKTRGTFISQKTRNLLK